MQTAETGLRICDDANIPLLAQLPQWTAAEIRLWQGRPVDEVMSRAGHGAILSDYLAMQVPARLARSVAADLRGEHSRRLFIAEKTVQYHLTHIYEKFGIRSRTELAAVHLGDGIPEV